MSEWTLQEHSTGELVVNVSGQEWKDACQKAFRKAAKNVTVPGFRKGNVPDKILHRYISDEQVRYEAVEANANDWLRKALDEHDLTPIDRPMLDFRNMNEESVDVVFTVTVEPEVTLGEYKGLKYELGEINVTDEDVDKEIDSLRERYADMETVEEAAQDGDTVNIDYEGVKDDVPFDGGTAQGYDLRLGSGSFIPGFEEQLIGAVAGESRDLNLTFPEDYHSEELAGAAVVFHVKVNEVKRKSVPELDDDFAKDLSYPGVETVEDLRKYLRERLETSRRNEAEREADDAFFAKVSEVGTIDLPDIMIQSETEEMLYQFENQIAQYGMDPGQYLKMIGQDEETLKESYRETAEKNVRLRLVLQAIAKAEGLTASDEEVEEELQNLASSYGMELDRVKQAVDLRLVKKDIINRKASDLVKEAASRD
ncbi:MAG: trigger factor [Solobacterium sp.]|nr:trigger factor [Solobacterium sp.]